jgi:hypothetical protein
VHGAVEIVDRDRPRDAVAVLVGAGVRELVRERLRLRDPLARMGLADVQRDECDAVTVACV